MQIQNTFGYDKNTELEVGSLGSDSNSLINYNDAGKFINLSLTQLPYIAIYYITMFGQ